MIRITKIIHMSGEPYMEELVCLKDTSRDGLGEVEARMTCSC